MATEVGGAADKTYTESLFMRGMSGDRGPNGTTRTVMITDTLDDGTTASPTIEDREGTAGFVRRTRTALGTGGPQTGLTVDTPWLSAPTAAANGQYARYLGTSVSETTVNRTGGNLVTRTNTSFDESGHPIAVLDAGDVSDPNDDICTKTSFVDVSGPAITNLAATEQSNSGDCSAAVGASNIMDSSRNYYGSNTLGATSPERNLTRTETLGNSGESQPWNTTWTADARIAYDGAGRVASTKDALDRETTTAYTVNGSDGLSGNRILTERTSTNPLGQTSSSKVNFKWGTPTETTDVGGLKSTFEYDQAGRVLRAWSAGRSSSPASTVPDAEFSYIADLKGSRVTTDVLNPQGGTTRSRVFYDGLMRERQTQSLAAGVDGGRLITENLYDSRGWLDSARGPYFNETAIPADASTATVVRAPASTIPSYTDYEYDREGRATKTALKSFGNTKSATTTAYDGTRTSTSAPVGATATTTDTDARGRTTSLKQYQGTDPTGPADETNYTYTPRGELAKVLSSGTGTPAARSTWEYQYDVRGRQVVAKDPDKGTTTTGYDVLDRPITTRDANEHTLWTGYDELGRKTQLRDTSEAGRLRASWTYTSAGAGTGQVQQTKRFDDVNSDGTDDVFATSFTYDGRGRPATSTLTLPNNVGLNGLRPAQGYVTTMSYYDDGSPKQIVQPTTAGTAVANEALNYSYDDLGNLDTLTGAGALVAGTSYTPLGQVAQRTLGPTVGNAVYENREYDDATARLTRQVVALQTSASSTQLDQRYAYDDAGNVTGVDDLPTAAGTTAIRQCLDYDYLQRMTQAWTSPTAGCATPATSSPNLGTTAPYWDRYEYSLSGNRTKWTQTRGTATTVHNSTYPTPNQPRPHAVTAVASTGAAAHNEALTYDAVGNLTARSGGPAGAQTIVWDREGHQKSVTNSAGQTTEYVYDADGARLLKKDETAGSTTLYVGSSEYTLTGTTLSLMRNYTVDGQPVATRTTNGLSIIVADRNNTGQLTIEQDSTQVSRRRFTPFGEQLAAPTNGWPDTKGYLGKTTDTSTGTTHLDAREYDTRLGRFLSVDPISDPTNPQQMNGYAYANNSPITSSDPTGLYIDGGVKTNRTAPVIVKRGGKSYAQQGGYYTAPGRTREGSHIAYGGDAKLLGEAKTRYNDTKRALGPDAPATRRVGAVHDALLNQIVKERTADYSVKNAGLALFRAVIFDGRSCRSDGNAVECGAEVAMIIPWFKLVKAFKLTRLESAAKTGPDLAQGFNSFRAAKRSLPSPGQGNVYDHVVEQSQMAAGRSGFDPRLIHNPYNLNAVPTAVNQARANYYSSIRPFSGGQTVRNWLNGQSFEQQFSFGMDITSTIQRGAPLP